MKVTYIIIGIIIIGGILFTLTRTNNKPVDVSTDTATNPVTVTSTTATTTMEPTSTNSAPITELKAQDEVVGTGAVAKAGDTVTVQYVGQLTNGTVFDASKNHGDQGFTFTLGAGQVIKGWDMGVAGMKEGGKRKLLIPASLAYGNQDVGNGLIPANSALIFEVELVKVGK
jgi:FKBP-type peptidyl-prolyl cis-trans isomerase